LWYDYATNGGTWTVSQNPQSDFGAPQASLVGTTLLIMNVNYITGLWRINSRGLRYVFESVRAVQWFDNGKRGLAQETAEAVTDTVRVLPVNQDISDPVTGLGAIVQDALHAALAAGVSATALAPIANLDFAINSRSYSLGQNYDLTIDRLWMYTDGTPETRRTTVVLTDNSGDGYPDQPDLFYKVTSNKIQSVYLFWTNQVNPPYEEPLYTVVAYETDLLMNADATQAIGTIAFVLTSSVSYIFDQTFWVYNGSVFGWQQNTTSFRAARGRGPNVAARWVSASNSLLPYSSAISFEWMHYAPTDNRINPSQTSIIDVFVLTYAYDSAVRQWITNGASLVDEPPAPTELQLAVDFASLETYKMFSDEIIWRPVTYVYLFGASADPSLQAQFKVVRVANSAVSDGEIQSQIIAAINAFFAISLWDFGETFYFTELAAYVHQQLVGLISSFVIVPKTANAAFGDGFEISCNADQIFISTAQISDILMIQSNTPSNLRIHSL
jgi:hypothetical protein